MEEAGSGSAWPTLARVLRVPELELALGRDEKGAELVVELGDRGPLLEELILEPAIGIAQVLLSLTAIERGAAFLTGHVARPEHLCQRSTVPRASFSLLGSGASAEKSW